MDAHQPRVVRGTDSHVWGRTDRHAQGRLSSDPAPVFLSSPSHLQLAACPALWPGWGIWGRGGLTLADTGEGTRKPAVVPGLELSEW